MEIVGLIIFIAVMFPGAVGHYVAQVKISMEEIYPELRAEQDEKNRKKQEKKDRKAARKGH